ncbi:MAG: TAXI family TRAP transporter solute-binding subunit [Proteobacteria bacterium]|nr:TAXI family TRAP transporter solute-binding subunit [Pseudomonadota bacterium]MBU1581265.1 TAXI family TRAP transporter solute-binding subunit [Pseudomonadota bacterium]MBU2627130.1 TAXI family TRAP transporter solute-binding subunit [Pseudomonadota bacterium]
MKKDNRFYTKLSLVLFVLLYLCVWSVSAGENLTIASGKAGGTWYPMGGAIADIVQNHVDGYNMSVMQGAGDANIIGVNKKMYTLGISFSFANADAASGNEQFTKPMNNIAGLAALYPSPLQIVVRGDSDIKTIEDLKGKRIAPGLKGTSGEVLVRNILKVHGLSYGDMSKIEHLAYADAAMLMKDGHIDAFMPFTTVPAPVIQDTAVSLSGGIRLISLSREKFDELKKLNEGYSAFMIAAGQYKGQNEDSLCIGSNNVVICQKSLPEKLVYDMTRALLENKDKFVTIHKVVESWTPEYAVRDIGVPLHPGALKYYREIGVYKQN